MKRKMKWALPAVLMVVALYLAAYTFLTSDYARQKFADTLSAKSGREFSIDGPLRVEWHWRHPRFYASQVRISNVEGASAPYMADIQEVDFTLKVWRWLFGRTEIPSLRIVNPKLNFEKLTEDQKNWDFPILSEGKLAKETALPDERGDMPIIGEIRIDGGEIVYKNVPRQLEMKLDMDMAQGKNHDVFVFKGKGMMVGKPFTLEAEGGSLELLRDSTKDFPLALTVNIGQTKFSIDGTFADPVQLRKLDATLKLSGPNLADLFYLMHIPFPPTPSYELTGHLKKEGDKWPFNGLKGRVGNSDLSGDVLYDSGGERPLLSGKLKSKRMDVDDLGGLIGLSPSNGKTKTAKADTLLPDTPLDLKRLRAGNMDLDLEAEKLNAPGWPLNAMHTHISLTNGLLRLDPLRFGLAGGTVTGFMELDGRTDLPKVKTELSLDNLGMKQFFAQTKFADFSEGRFGGDIKLQGRGTSFAKVLGASDGRIVVSMKGGKASLFLVEASDLDIAEMAPLFFGKDKTTQIRCAVGDFPVRNGQLRSRVFVFDTADTNLKGDVRINLKDETINATIDARPKDASLLSLQSKILLTGNFRDPRVTIDPVSTGLRGATAAALGAVMPPAAILPFVGLGTGEDSDCANLLRNATLSMRGRGTDDVQGIRQFIASNR